MNDSLKQETWNTIQTIPP